MAKAAPYRHRDASRAADTRWKLAKSPARATLMRSRRASAASGCARARSSRLCSHLECAGDDGRSSSNVEAKERILPHRKKQPTLSVGEVSARAGVAASALRFYESRDLISADRTEGGQRRYRRDVLRRVAFIRAAQRVGLSL